MDRNAVIDNAAAAPGCRALLHVARREGDLLLSPLVEGDRAALALACAADPDIWAIYSTSWDQAHFDASFDALLADAGRMAFAVRLAGAVVGMTAYLRMDEGNGVLEIGNSYLLPALRGTGLNNRMKRLMIDHAFAQGFRRIEFRIDARNGRSQAAAAKLGAVREGLLRAERITWTGHVRDTVIFGLLREEWTGGAGQDQAGT